MSDFEFPLPPPSFEFLVLSLKMQAEMRLGLLPGLGSEDDQSSGPDLAGARHAIDMLAMIVEKTRGNLSIEEGRLIENSLTELRFRFVQTSETVHKEKAQKEQTKAEEADAAKASPPASDASGSSSGS